MNQKIKRLSAIPAVESLTEQSFSKAYDDRIIAERLTDSTEKIPCAVCGGDLADCVEPSGDGRCTTCFRYRRDLPEGRIQFRGEHCSPRIIHRSSLKRLPPGRAYAFD
jgi:hypothetical protein